MGDDSDSALNGAAESADAPVGDIELKYVLADISKAIGEEINAARRDPSRFFRIANGERLHDGSDGYLYRFQAELALPVQPDTPIRLHLSDDDAVGGVLLALEDFDVLLELREDIGEEVPEARLSMEPWFIYEHLREKLEHLAENPPEYLHLPRALLGFDESELGEDMERAKSTAAKLLTLGHPNLVPNDDQEVAIARCADSSLHFVWGPPGTGKTACLAQVTRALREQGERVLVLAHANAAVDVAMLRVADALADTRDLREGRVLRIGTPQLKEARERAEIDPWCVLARKHPDLLERRDLLERQRASLSRKLARAANEKRPALATELKEIRDELSALRETLRQAESSLVSETTVLGATLSRLAIDGVVWGWKPDAVLIDEASMGMFPAVLAAAFRARLRVLVFGDFRQLPPIFLSSKRSATVWLGRDAFEIAGVRGNVDSGIPDGRLTMLQTQYRMAEPICRVVSKLAYGGRLRDHPSLKKSLASLIAQRPFEGRAAVVVDSSELFSACFREPKAGSYSRCNPLHALIAAFMAAQAHAEGFNSIGIISPYRAQAGLIAKAAHSLGLSEVVTAATVHRFQGSERDLIIYDLTDGFQERDASNLTGRNLDTALRLINVALSRARGKLVIIADCKFVRERHSSRSPSRRALRLLGETLKLDPTHVFAHEGTRKSWYESLAGATDVIVRAIEATTQPVYVNVPEGVTLPEALLDLLRTAPASGIPVTVFADFDTAVNLEESDADLRLLVLPAGFFVFAGSQFAAIGGRDSTSPIVCLEEVAVVGALHRLCVGGVLAKPRPSADIEARLLSLCGRCPDCGDSRLPRQTGRNQWALQCKSHRHAATALSQTELQEIVTAIGTRCPQCDSQAIVRGSRGGYFLGCENFSNGCPGKLPHLHDIFGGVS